MTARPNAVLDAGDDDAERHGVQKVADVAHGIALPPSRLEDYHLAGADGLVLATHGPGRIALRKRVVAVFVTVLVVAGIAAPAAARTHVAASGDFVVAVDFTTVAVNDASHDRCVLTVNGTLTFAGTLVGGATGTTTALIFAPCRDVAVTPPGTYLDLFQFKGTFTSTVADIGPTPELQRSHLRRHYRVGGIIGAGDHAAR